MRTQRMLRNISHFFGRMVALIKNLTMKPFALLFLAFLCFSTAYPPKVFAGTVIAKERNFGKVLANPVKTEAIGAQISNFSDSTKTYGDADFELGATTNSSSPITYSSSNPSIITVYQSTVDNNWYAKIIAAGSATITASVAADLFYSASDSSITITVNTAKLSVTANPETKVYGSADPIFTFYISGLVNGDDSATVIQGALSRVAGQNVGTYAITANTLTAGANYTIVYTGANLSITKANLNISANAETKVYGAADPTLTYSVIGLVNGDVVTTVITGVLSRAAGQNVGTYAITQNTLSAGGNYTILFTGANLTITKANLSINANSQTKVYGSADPILTYAAIGLANGDVATVVITGALSRAAGQNVGTYPIAQNTLSAGANYTIVYTGANLSITKANLTIVANAQTKVYGSADPQFSYTETGLVNNDPQSVITGSLSRNAGENVGSYPIVQGSLSAGGNYNIQFTSANLTISKANLTIVANAQTKVYGSADPQLTYTVTGLVNNDAQSVVTGSLSRNAGESVGSYPINQGTIVAGNNYTIVYTGANLTITKANLNIVANPQTKVYGDPDPQLTYNLSGLVNNDGLSIVTGSLTRVAGENVGKYAINLGSLTAGGNYTINFTSDYLSITQAQQQITWDQLLKVGCGAVMQIKLTASTSSGLPISYTVSDPSVATVNGSTLLINKIAQANVIASQSGNNNYMAAADVILPIIPGLDSFVHQKWTDILVFDNSQGNFDAWQWYKNDSAISGDTLQYYQENGPLNGTYFVIATGVNGGKLSTCPVTISPTTPLAGSISVSPNPVPKGASFSISNSYSSQALQGAKITITNILGTQISVINNVSASVNAQAPGTAGIYVIRLILANGQSASTNLLVE